VILQKETQEILPKVYSIDAGIIVKPTKNILLKATLWKSVSETEFVYVGDEGIIEPGGRSMRSGIDLSLRYQLAKWLFADIDANLARPRSIDAPKGENYIPLAPLFSSIGGITIKNKERLSGSLRYRYLQNRPADETGSSIAKGYFITDALINYRIKKWELFALVENLFNIKWKEAQFYTESKLQNESMPVSEMHFTPGAPLFFKTGFSLSF
jgi:outer membrane receptor protein involved in Fe transport